MILLSAQGCQENSSCAVLIGTYYFLYGSTVYKVIPSNAQRCCALVKLIRTLYVAADREYLLLLFPILDWLGDRADEMIE